MTPGKCPNCNHVITESRPGCLLHDLIQVIREREDMREDKLLRIHATTDVDALWCRLGEVVDDLQNGEFEEQA